MKKVLILIIMLSLGLGIGKAQTNVYHPFLNESYWNVCVTDFAGTGYYSYTTIGDTLINNQGYKKIKRENGNPVFDTLYCLREDIPNKLVFIWNGNADIQLYNFNLNLGDWIYLYVTGNICTGLLSYQVSYIDSILLGFGYTKRFYLTSTNQTTQIPIYLIEGVGSLEEPLTVISCSVDPAYSLVCNSQNGVQIYGNNCSQMPPPNAVQNDASIATNSYWISLTNDQFTINNSTSDQTAVDVSVFDVSGRLITSLYNLSPNSSTSHTLQSPGIYLINIAHPSGFQITQKLFLSN